MEITEQDFKTFELTGEQEVRLLNIVDKFDNDCIIAQWHEEFTLIQKKGIKCKISKIQAIQLIELLKLNPNKSDMFRHATTWKL